MRTTTQQKTNKRPYNALLQKLSHQSVVKQYDAYRDIEWDAAANQLDPTDPRFEKPVTDPLGGTSWYRALPQPTRARIGLHDIVLTTKFGIIFESILKRGLLEFAATLPDGAPEFRYAMHEVVEEAQHSMMFQELINRSGMEVTRLPPLIERASRRVVALGRDFPEMFFMFVLGGEEPIDRVQRRELGLKRDMHPLLRRIMQIHVTEEARHLCFARAFLRERVPQLSSWRRARMSAQTPILLSQMARLMMEPSQHLIATYAIPDHVIDEAYVLNREHRGRVVESVGSVRKLCEELELLPKWSVPLWKRGGVWSAPDLSN